MSVKWIIFGIIAGYYFLINIMVIVLYKITQKRAAKKYNLMLKEKQNEMIEQHNHEIEVIFKNAKGWQDDKK